MDRVNGHSCRGCSDVALAKRNIDPAKHKPEVPDEAASAKDPTCLLDVVV